MNFLFDVVNEVAGYTEKYFEETKEIIDHEGLIQKYRTERGKYTASNIDESDLLGDKSPHCLMVIEGIQTFLDMPETKLKIGGITTSLSHDYLDALLIRLLPSSDVWYRNHFPVILETNKSYYFNELIFNQMNQNELVFPVIEYGSA